MDLQLGTLKQIAQPVEDLERAVAFYRDRLQVPFIGQFGPLAFFDLDGVRLLLERNQARPEDDHGAVLYFDVPEVHTAHHELVARGITFEQEPHLIHRDDAGTFGRAGAETWMAFFRDSEGNSLAIVASDQPAQ